jgi:hypothetical protein
MKKFKGYKDKGSNNKIQGEFNLYLSAILSGYQKNFQAYVQDDIQNLRERTN